MREQVLAILRRYVRGNIKPSGGNNVLMKCPFHKGGQEHKPSFSVDVAAGTYHCFTGGCAASQGGDLERLLKLFQLPQATIDAELQYLRPQLERNKELHRAQKQNFHVDRDPFVAECILPESLIGVFAHEPTDLIRRGFDPALLAHMQIGYDRNQQRVMYPIRDMYGNLAGFVGGATSKEQSPKYLVYKGGTRLPSGQLKPGPYGQWFDEEYPGYEFENHNYLWNWHQVWRPSVFDSSAKVYIVEGYKAGLWMMQNGYSMTTALMGSYVSETQRRMLHRLGGTAVLCLDNDNAGRRARRRVGEILWGPMGGRVTAIEYPPVDDGSQPDDYPPDQLHRIIRTARPIIESLTGIGSWVPPAR